MMIAITMMFWTYEYKHIRPSGRIAHNGERLTLCFFIVIGDEQPQGRITASRLSNGPR